ncbi:MAG: hypothetical protein IAI48_15330 [Candidatus Eremiobacteraeota bacterium]|nr:hypothetical protein [Candidatus Eremiobacteraeota bacterium]
MIVQAPDGSKVENHDRERTIAAYALIDAEADCRCGNCRNYRSAFDITRLDPSLVVACELLGIDPYKALEVMPFTFDAATSLLLYQGHYPFFGTLVDQRIDSGDATWHFSWFTVGSARITPDAVELTFYIQLPWVLTERHESQAE